MARHALTFIALAGILSSCQTTDQIVTQRVNAAAVTAGEARAAVPFPDLPEACVAKVGRVKPGGEPWVVTFKRVDIVADNRDRQAEDCAAWGRDMKNNYGTAAKGQ